ncbi:hypothetical protein NM688_g6388 [Phlebia brevispora]|uniref:Uncharacterized protein n=1 Tax=Phlebia brevispora TaxID=194682 RepID=A0ACC1SGH0_9APHY|nr:hypothetical protein NM688_g6388 [Phlebia brevispora]
MLVQTFPQELIDAFIDCLRGDKKSLARCTEVCRSFLPAARRGLFETVVVHGRQRSFEDFLAFLQSATHIGGSVGHLHLKSEAPGHPEVRPQDGDTVTIPVLVQILSLLPRLVELRLSRVAIDVSGADGDLPAFHITSSFLHDVRVTNKRNAVALLRVITPKRLRIEHLPFGVFPPTAQEAEVFPRDGHFPSDWALEGLRLSMDLETCWIGGLMKDTPTAHTLSKVHLEFRHEDAIKGAESIMRAAAPNLRHLKLDIAFLDFEEFNVLESVHLLNLAACRAVVSIFLNIYLDLPAFQFLARALIATSGTLQHFTVQWDWRGLDNEEMVQLFTSNGYDGEFSELENALLHCRSLQAFTFRSLVPTIGSGEQQVQDIVIQRLPMVHRKGLLKFEVVEESVYAFEDDNN